MHLEIASHFGGIIFFKPLHQKRIQWRRL